MRWTSSSVWVLPVLVFACAGSEVRDVTYGPNLRYVAKQDVSSVMGRLAKVSVQLDELVRSESEDKPIVAAEVVRLLAEMQSAAADLDKGRKTNHPLLDDNLALFRDDLEKARSAAESTPPNYFMAGAVAGSCFLYCHTGQNRR